MTLCYYVQLGINEEANKATVLILEVNSNVAILVVVIARFSAVLPPKRK